jgi:glycosyltransferase involved in cell wall biosynthesis
MTSPLFEVPLNRRIIDSTPGLIVHSHYAANLIRRERPDAAVGVAPATMAVHPGHSRRPELGIPDDAVLFASYGQITAEKQIELALQTFRRLRKSHVPAHYLLVGEATLDVDLPSLIAGLGLADSVHHVGYATDLSAFVDWLHTADVVVNLRYPTVGETSAVALRAMAAGKPLIVFDHGWYGELPYGVAAKTPPGDEAALLQAMARLAGSAELRRAMGRAALAHVRDNCLPSRTADAYIAFLNQLLATGLVHA